LELRFPLRGFFFDLEPLGVLLRELPFVLLLEVVLALLELLVKSGDRLLLLRLQVAELEFTLLDFLANGLLPFLQELLS